MAHRCRSPCRGCRSGRLGDIAARRGGDFRHLIAIARFGRNIGFSRRESGRGPCRASLRHTSNRWTRERVTALRSYRKIPVFRPGPDGIEPWLNLNKAARLLGITPKTLRRAAEAGKIEGLHPLPDGPWIFRRSELGKPDAQQIVHRARQNQKYPRDRIPISKTYSFQRHREMGVMKQDCSGEAIAATRRCVRLKCCRRGHRPIRASWSE
ncbi:helix-turn-helix domain-containing protein [Allomesorhizobium camelthorni]|uniref:helix-turn-helix domain-containing protein n=1 Tax=Allomesorhizobium camelthorni TaxID=475069 RepID=UPI0031B5A48F